MAVYTRKFQSYQGPAADPRLRFWVLSRYAFGQWISSKFFLAFFIVCLAAPIVAGILIYLRYNLPALAMMNLQVAELVKIDANFFEVILEIQSGLGLFLAAVVGPGLIAPDLANNALPLYFSRPLARSEYVLGKLLVMVAFLSMLSWIPLLLLFLFQGSLAGLGWMVENWRIAAAIWVGSWIWILALALLAVAMSAWVKWRPVAGLMIFGSFLVAGGFATVTNAMLHTDWGNLINLLEMIKITWHWLFDNPKPADLPVWTAWPVLAVHGALCLWVLARRIRAYEVVR